MIIATAGHVDHGKTALVKQLTGIDTDSLQEEKRRGLSINLGFAYRPIGAHHTLGFIDVPGHKRFINTMISGVSGIDLGMLVVAADDGIMPQTLEHLDVLRLLGVKEFIAIVTKLDRVEASRVEEVALEVADLLREERCDRVFAVSNRSAEGITALLGYLEQRARHQLQRSTNGYFRLSVDRAFLLKGSGLILTGTASAGAVAPGDELRLLPADIAVRVRSVHVDDRAARIGHAGHRCALNVAGALNKDQVQRGDTLTSDTRAALSERFDSTVSLLHNAPGPVKHLSRVTVHIGAKRLSARLYLLGARRRSHLAPGDECLAQLILEQPLPCCRGDRFLLRDDSQSFTLGGGMILDPFAPKWGKERDHRMQYLIAMQQDTPDQALQYLVQNFARPINLDTFFAAWNLRPPERELLMQSDSLVCFKIDGGDFALARQAVESIREQLLAAVRAWHRANPGEPGMPPTRLAEQLNEAAPGGLFRALLADLLKANHLQLEDGVLRVAGHQPSLSSAEQAIWHQLHQQLLAHALHTPLVSVRVESTGLDKRQVLASLELASRQGKAIKLNSDRYGLLEHMLEHAQIVADLANEHGTVTIADYKHRIGSGRRLAIEILEYFDRQGYTRRRGEARVVLPGKLSTIANTQ